MYEDGLFCSEEDVEKYSGTNAFPTLHRINDESVAKRMTTVIRESLPEGTQKHFASKSVKKGTVNIMSEHPKATVFSVCARSGHTTRTTLDSYLDKKNLLRGLPAANSLFERKDLRTRVVLPSFDAVGGANLPQIEDLVAQIFVVNIQDCEKGERLHPALC